MVFPIRNFLAEVIGKGMMMMYGNDGFSNGHGGCNPQQQQQPTGASGMHLAVSTDYFPS
jgi:hypothetical protein